MKRIIVVAIWVVLWLVVLIVDPFFGSEVLAQFTVVLMRWWRICKVSAMAVSTVLARGCCCWRCSLIVEDLWKAWCTIVMKAVLLIAGCLMRMKLLALWILIVARWPLHSNFMCRLDRSDGTSRRRSRLERRLASLLSVNHFSIWQVRIIFLDRRTSVWSGIPPSKTASDSNPTSDGRVPPLTAGRSFSWWCCRIWMCSNWWRWWWQCGGGTLAATSGGQAESQSGEIENFDLLTGRLTTRIYPLNSRTEKKTWTCCKNCFSTSEWHLRRDVSCSWWSINKEDDEAVL